MAAERMTVLGVYADRLAVDRAVNELTAAGFPEAEMSVIVPGDQGETKVEQAKNREPQGVADKVTDLTSKDTKDISSGKSHDVPAENTKLPQAAATGAGIGAALGGTLGVFAALTGLVVPGIGALLIGGPLFGAFAGATAGGAVGVLVGLGIPEDEAKLYQDRLKKGGILLAIHASSEAKVQEARAVLQRTGATDIATTHVARRSPMANEGIPKVVGR
jgi:Protein of unknown function (DUF1269)